MVGGRPEGKHGKITVNGGKNWLIPILESFKLCQRLTTSVMTGSDILRRKLKNDVTREGIPSRITKPVSFFLIKEFLKIFLNFFPFMLGDIGLVILKRISNDMLLIPFFLET